MGGTGNNTIFVNPAKIQNVAGRLFFGMKKVAILETMTERQAVQDQMSWSVFCFFMLAETNAGLR
jgi:hypothetical protein